MKENINPSRSHFRLIALVLILTVVFPGYAQLSTTDSLKTVKEALPLVHAPEPAFTSFQQPEMDPTALADLGFEQVYANLPHTFTARDGKKLVAYRYERESNTTIILLHGVLSSAFMMNKTAGLLREALQAEVFALDFRGHGQSEGTPGDVDYIDQYADDVADVIASVKKENPHGKIILAGHSMGGGIALRYAMKKNAPKVDGYLLLAPHLEHNSPTLPQPSGMEAEQVAEPFLKLHISRIIGLKMLNSVGNHQFDHLPILFFNVPTEMPLKTYSYRANESVAPADYQAGLSAVDKPMLVLVGSEDEAFVAPAFGPAVKKYSQGEFLMVNGTTHNGIRHHSVSMQRIRQWGKTHFFIQQSSEK